MAEKPEVGKWYTVSNDLNITVGLDGIKFIRGKKYKCIDVDVGPSGDWIHTKFEGISIIPRPGVLWEQHGFICLCEYWSCFSECSPPDAQLELDL